MISPISIKSYDSAINVKNCSVSYINTESNDTTDFSIKPKKQEKQSILSKFLSITKKIFVAVFKAIVNIFSSKKKENPTVEKQSEQTNKPESTNDKESPKNTENLQTVNEDISKAENPSETESLTTVRNEIKDDIKTKEISIIQAKDDLSSLDIEELIHKYMEKVASGVEGTNLEDIENILSKKMSSKRANTGFLGEHPIEDINSHIKSGTLEGYRKAYPEEDFSFLSIEGTDRKFAKLKPLSETIYRVRGECFDERSKHYVEFFNLNNGEIFTKNLFSWFSGCMEWANGYSLNRYQRKGEGKSVIHFVKFPKNSKGIAERCTETIVHRDAQFKVISKSVDPKNNLLVIYSEYIG